jgi:hypothetical protein
MDDLPRQLPLSPGHDQGAPSRSLQLAHESALVWDIDQVVETRSSRASGGPPAQRTSFLHQVSVLSVPGKSLSMVAASNRLQGEPLS